MTWNKKGRLHSFFLSVIRYLMKCPTHKLPWLDVNNLTSVLERQRHNKEIDK